MIKKKEFIIFCLLFVLAFYKVSAQDTSLTNYVQKIQSAFNSGTEQELAAFFPSKAQKASFENYSRGKYTRTGGTYEILERKMDKAYVLMAGKVITGSDSGSETFYSAFYNGIYEFSQKNGIWAIDKKEPIGEGNRIYQHAMVVDVLPDSGVHVIDTLSIEIGNKHGFWFSLNNDARIKELLLNDKKVDFVAANGIVLLKAAKKGKCQLKIEYFLPVLNKDRFRIDYGFFNDTLGKMRAALNWHPLFSYDNLNDQAFFKVHARIPKEYHLTTSFPQVDEVQEGIRHIRGASVYPTHYAAIYFDKNWSPKHVTHKDFSIDFFVSKDYRPSADTLLPIVKETYDLLTEKFGPPYSNYLGLVQDASTRYSSWQTRANDIVTSSIAGTMTMYLKPFPRANIQHEIGHGWTAPTGKGRIFLLEGWANFIETYFLRKHYGDSIVNDYYNLWKKFYYKEKADSTISLWDDVANSGVSYTKGVWVFRVLNDLLGAEVFEKGMREYRQVPQGKQRDIYAFSKALSKAAGKDVWYILEPWMKSKTIPTVSATLNGNIINVIQVGEAFVYPLEIKIVQEGKTLIKRYVIKDRQSEFTVPELQPNVSATITIDPDSKALIKIQ